MNTHTTAKTYAVCIDCGRKMFRLTNGWVCPIGKINGGHGKTWEELKPEQW